MGIFIVGDLFFKDRCRTDLKAIQPDDGSGRIGVDRQQAIADFGFSAQDEEERHADPEKEKDRQEKNKDSPFGGRFFRGR